MNVTKFSLAQLLTCRYWAFGPECPDLDECAFAHWDTGRLASHFQQRGTCSYWRSARCYHGSRCFYEHRETGVPGLYQGLVELHGLNLEIADAASRSGFNTFNHVALFDLIWSIRRVALRSSGPAPALTTLPNHPVYPDRYRPLGIGDNTARKRPPTNDINRLPSSHRNMSKVKNKTTMLPPPQEPRSTSVVRGTQVSHTPAIKQAPQFQLPILTSKRQKLDQMGKYRVEQGVIRHSPDQTRKDGVAATIDELQNVRTELEKAQRGMTGCQRAMKDQYDRNSTLLSDDVILPGLKALSESLFTVHDKAKAGIDSVRKTITLLSDLKAGLYEGKVS